MATFGSLINGLSCGDLPPAGEKLIWRTKPQPPPDYENFDAYWVDSGTSALALTIIAARQLRPDLENPEVILPAYGCPDLVAAAVYAKVQPVLVDIGYDDPGYDLDQLQNNINKNTLAVIAVNFLGIRDRLLEIKSLLPKNTYLIEDNAQCYKAISDPLNIIGDFAITSFGRGKPVGLLGGGLALIRKEIRSELNTSKLIKASKESPGKTRLKAIIYNALLNPYAYWLINRLPLLNLGETTFKPLKEILEMDNFRKGILQENIKKYLDTKPTASYNIGGGENLCEKYNDRLIYPLRIPFLKNNEKPSSEKTFKRLGITRMYKKSLINIEKVDQLVKYKSTTNADKLARELLTIPYNSIIKKKHIIAIKNLFTN